VDQFDPIRDFGLAEISLVPCGDVIYHGVFAYGAILLFWRCHFGAIKDWFMHLSYMSSLYWNVFYGYCMEWIYSRVSMCYLLMNFFYEILPMVLYALPLYNLCDNPMSDSS